jgi:hypothetical protein
VLTAESRSSAMRPASHCIGLPGRELRFGAIARFTAISGAVHRIALHLAIRGLLMIPSATISPLLVRISTNASNCPFSPF